MIEHVTITDFLHARIADDEKTLKRGYDVRETIAALARHTLNQRVPGFLGRTPEAVAAYMREISKQATALDGADRERRLAECEAKRRIVDWCSGRDRVWVGGIADDPTDPKNYAPGGYVHPEDAPVLRMLAVVYADHPDYQEAWRP